LEPLPGEKSENGGHKQLEKTESMPKVSTAVGGEDSSSKPVPLESTSRVNIGSQTSIESQPEKSPPPSPVASNSGVSKLFGVVHVALHSDYTC